MIIDFKEDEILTTTELYKKIGICKKTWGNHKDQILEDLADAWDYKIIAKGNKINYHFIKKHYDYEYYRGNNKYRGNKDAIIEKYTLMELNKEPRNSAKNISELLEQYELILKLEYAPNSRYEYVRQYMQKAFLKEQDNLFDFNETKEPITLEQIEEKYRGTIGNFMWCQKDPETKKYVPMPEEHIEAMYNIFSKYSDDTESAKRLKLDLIEMCERDYITKEQRDQIFGKIETDKYICYLKEFRQKYHYTPVKIGLFNLNKKAKEIAEKELNIKGLK